MFTLTITAEQMASGEGFVTIWENDEGVTRITLELTQPGDTDTEFVAKATPLRKFAAMTCAGIGNRGAIVTFNEAGVPQRVEAQ